MKRIIYLLFIFPTQTFPQETLNINGQYCNLHGSASMHGKSYYLNQLKNRFQFPGPMDFDSSIGFQDLVRSSNMNDFNQGKAIRLRGYVSSIKTGGIESCNCRSKDPLYRDTHIELAMDENHTGSEYTIIVEVTPRIREILGNKGIDWTTRTLKQTIKGKKVEVTGWLFYDSEHENASFANDPQDEANPVNWRASCWEIHPVTDLNILPGELVKNNTPTESNSSGDNDLSPPKLERQKTISQKNSIENQGNDNFKYLLAALFVIAFIILLWIVLGKR